MDALLAAMAREEKIRAAYGASVAETADALRELQRRLRIGWDSARDCLPVPFPKLKILRNSPDAALSEFVQNRRDACKKAMKKLEQDFADDSQKLLDEMAMTAPAMEALLELTLAFDRQFTADKRRGGLLDYADLEHLTAQLLTEEDDSPTELALSVQRQYAEIMVDEYQDVSRVQDSIFRAVSREGRNLFFVGDVKQSIYRFRLADPTIITEKYLSYRDHDSATPGEPRRILLQENFRTERRVSWYAKQLEITAKYLSEVVKNVSKRTPNEWIDSYVVLEIRVMLKNSTKSIKEITEELNFPNQSFLGKYFKEHVGVSPSEYRKG
jgi:ATP-dependent helicase/nuclease subunit A